MNLKQACAGLLFTATLFGTVPPVSAAPLPFPDMEHSWYRYREAVQFLKERDVIGGYPEGTFRPRTTINRAELLKILFKGRSDTEPITRSCFTDVAEDAWYAPFVCAAKQRGIVSGYSDGSFKPEEAVNFAEAIKMILNAYSRDIDEAKGENWYVPYVQELDEKDILPRHSYIPWEPLSRERAADLLWRMLLYEEERIVPNLSPGCGKAAIAAPTTVVVYGQERQFLLTVPAKLSNRDPAPLIVAFHGRTNSNERVRGYYRLDREMPNAIIAYPAAISNGNGSYSWADGGNKPQEIRDIAFFDAIVEVLAERYCVDMDNISVVGHSLGAWMANSVACVRGDVVRASATVGGDTVITKCNGPAAAMIAHNPKDNLASFAGAEVVRRLRMETNQCAWEESAGPSELNCVRYRNCPGGNDVLWCPHTIDTEHDGQFYPHTWPRETAKIMKVFFDSLD